MRAWTRSVRRAAGGLCLLAGWLPCVFTAGAAFVYETPREFLSAGDFNGDGTVDVLVLDKLTGNARVGYQNAGGTLAWSSSLGTGAEYVSGAGVEKFLQADRDALAVTSPELNRVHWVDLSNPNSVPAPTVVTPAGIGPHGVVGLRSPLAPDSGATAFTLVASSFNDAPAERLDLLPGAGSSSPPGQFNESGPFERGNAMDLDPASPTFAVGLVRGGTNDTLHIWQFTNAPSIVGALGDLPPGIDYAFGRFNGESLPRFWLYVPGGTNVTLRSLESGGAGFEFGAPVSLSFTQNVERVYVVREDGGASAFIQFGDGIQGARLPGGAPALAEPYRVGAGKGITGLVPLDNGRFALLSAPTGTVNSIHAQVMSFDGTNVTQISSNNLPTLTPRAGRANVWLFQNEPFVNPAPHFLASLNAPDWSSSASGLPGSLSVQVETDSGAATGLGNASTIPLAPPAGAAYGLTDQYREDVSLFSYAPPRPAEPVDATLSPPPGVYDGPVTLVFTSRNPAHEVIFRTGPRDAWRTYTTPFLLTHDATVQYYGRNPAGGARSPLKTAAYGVGTTGETPPAPFTLPGFEGTNAPPPFNPNIPVIAANGTVFFSRHSELSELENVLGPSPYSGFVNSPFNAGGFAWFHLEDFEDGALNTPGVTPGPGWIVASSDGGGDSVAPGGRSYYSGGTQSELTLTFNAAALGGRLPTHAGIVWTDVGLVSAGAFGFGNVVFTARDADGNLLETNIGVNLGDGMAVPSSSEDRFFGVVHAGGISSITLAMPNSVDWEVDHLQYGHLDDGGFNDSIWAINLDGNGETFITAGARPRVSPDGRWLAFLRGGGALATRGDIWVRDLTNGQETRVFTNSDAITAVDWNGSRMELVFDHACVLLRKPFDEPAAQLPLTLTPECLNGAPVVNPVDGRLAFHNLGSSVSHGVYLTPPDWSARTKIIEPATLRLRWPAWSPDGTRLVMADQRSSAFINSGVNLWTASADGSNLRQITALAEPDGFPRGAVWTADGRALVGAGSIGGTNGLWVIPVTADGSACHCPPRLLPTSAGSRVDFAGSVIDSSAEVSYVDLDLFIRLEPAAMVVYWSTNYDGFTLESAAAVPSRFAWTPVSGPYFRAGPYFEYREPRASLESARYFRLRFPGVLVLTPSEPDLALRLEGNAAVLNWPAGNTSYTLETTTNLMAPISWTALEGPYAATNGVFEFRHVPSTTQTAEFFRLRWP